MATNELQARITADISGLESGLKKAEKLQADYAKSISNTQKDIADNIAISKQYEKAVEQLNKELKDGTISQKEYSKQLNRIKRDEKETQIETANLRKELVRLKRDQKDLASTNTTVSKGMTSFGKQTANATPTVIEFSRVIQDAPYGIRGYANNLQQTATSFGYLQKSAGGTIPALKAVASSFLGPAGIVFAVSTVTSLLVTYGDELLSSVRSTNALASATADYLGEAKAEITTLNSLVKIASDEANSKEVREKALKEINENYSDYLGNLDLEALKTDQVRKSIEKLTESLILRAKIEGLQALITEKAKDASEDIVDAELQRTEAYKRVNSEIDQAIKKNAFLQQSLKDVSGEKEKIKAFVDLVNKYEDVRDVSSGAIAAIGEYKKASDNAKELNKDLDNSLTSLVKLQEGFKVGLLQTESEITNIDEGAVIIDVEKIQKAREKAAKKAEKDEESLAKTREKQRLRLIEIDNYVNDEIFRNAEQSTKAVEAIYTSHAKEIERTKDKTDIINANKAFQDIQAIADKIQEIQKKFPELKLAEIDFAGMDLSQLDALQNKLTNTENTVELFTNATKSAFSGLASSLSQSLNTGSTILDGFLSSLISGFAEILAQKASFIIADKALSNIEIGTKQAKASGDGIAIATSAAAALGPAGAIALPGLIASQLAIINGAFAGVKAFSFAGGGIVPGGLYNGDKVPSFLNSGEVVFNGKQQANVLMAIAEGNVSTRKPDNNDMLVANTIVRGDQLELILKRYRSKR